MKSAPPSIHRAIGLVRRGDFIGAATDPVIMGDLERVSSGNDVPLNQDWITSRALLAEINDQIGRYKIVADVFSSPDAARSIRKSLAESRKNFANTKSSPRLSDEMRRLIRAQSLYELQSAINSLRRFDSHLDEASARMTECRNTLKLISEVQSQQYGDDACQFHGVLSLFHYWEGRVEMARNNREDAAHHFEESMREIENNLKFHYSGRLASIPPTDERMVYASYSLASAMGFGVAQLSHISGDLNRALALLRPTSALLMGTADVYRRGYAQMLIGAAERAAAGRNAEGLAQAILTLKGSLTLFEGTETHQLRHGLHQARSHHQLALAHLYMAQSPTIRGAAKDKHLSAANHHLRFGHLLLKEFEEAGFGDPELRYDLRLTSSRILCEKGEFQRARETATAALRIADTYKFAPGISRAKCHVAIAEALIAQFDHQAAPAGLLEDANNCLEKALKVPKLDAALTAVIHLYEARIFARQKQMSKARQKFHEAWHKREKEVQNGWVRQLADEVKKEVAQPGVEFVLNLEHLEKDLRNKAEIQQGGTAQVDEDRKPLWDIALEEFERFMIRWAEETTAHESYRRVGLRKGKWFNIKRKLKLND